MIICPNCDNGLKHDEQLIIFGGAGETFQIDHVSIFSQPNIKIHKICDSREYDRLRID